MNTKRNKIKLRRFVRISIVLFIVYIPVVKNLEAQNILNRTISLDFVETPTKLVLKHIQTTTGIGFSYSPNLVNLEQNITIRFNDIKLVNALDIIFENQNIMYIVKSEMIILQPKPQNLDKIIIRGRVKSEDNSPIEFASVQLLNSKQGAIADELGNFRMVLKKSELDDTLIISSMGYDKRSFFAKTFSYKGLHTVYLNKKIYDLEEIQIQASNYHTETIGNDGFFSFGAIYIDTHGQQTVLFIENKENKIGKITGINFHFSKKGNTEAPIRVRLYSIDTISGTPAKDLLPEVIVVKPNTDGGWFQVDLSKLNISLPKNGFFAGLEGIYPGIYTDFQNDGFSMPDDYFENKPIFPKTINYGQQLSYSRKRGNNTWHYSVAHTWFQLEKQNYNVMISADIQVYKRKNKNKD